MSKWLRTATAIAALYFILAALAVVESDRIWRHLDPQSLPIAPELLSRWAPVVIPSLVLFLVLIVWRGLVQRAIHREQGLRRRQEAVLQALPVGVIQLGCNSRILEVNAMAREILGGDLSALPGPSPEDLGDRTVDRSAIADLGQASQQSSVDCIIKGADGRPRHVRMERVEVDGAGTEARAALVLENVTDLYLKSERLAKIEHPYLALYEANPDPVLMLGPAAEISSRNSACRRLNWRGETPEQFAALFTADDRVDVDNAFFACRNSRESQVFVATLDTEPQQIVRAALIPAGLAGKPETAVVLRDITQLRTDHAQLAETQRFLVRVLDQMGEGLVIVDPKTQAVERCNRAAVDLFGYSQPRDILGPARKLFTDEDHYEQLIEYLRYALPKNRTLRGMYPLRHADGRTLQVAYTITMLGADNPQGDRPIAILRDVSDELRAERGRSELSDILQTTPDLVFTVDGDGRLLSINPAARKAFGLDAEQDFGGMHVSTFLASGTDTSFNEGVEVAAREGSWLGEIQMRKPGEGAIPVSLVLVAHGAAEASVDRYTAIGRDISGQKHYESELRALSAHLRNVREEEKQRIAQELHDVLGQDLTALKLDAAWLSDRLGAGSETAVRHRSGQLTRLLDETVEDLRRIMYDLRPPLLDDCGLVAAIGWLVETYGERTATRLHLDADREEYELRMDTAINAFRIVQEAVTNGIRHAAAENLWISLGSGGGMLNIEISDDGCGLPAAVEKPSSFGLSNMRDRAIAMGGNARISARRDGGTTVSVWMPIAGAGAAGEAPAP